MAISIPPEISVRFHFARRRSRVRRILLWSPVVFAVASGAAAGFLAWRGHGLLHLLSKVKPSFVSQDFTLIFWLLVLSGIGGVLCVLLLIAASFKKSGVVELPYCVACRAPDETNHGRCEICGTTLAEKREVLYPDLFDDAKVLRAFGLER